jgi:UDP-N-acetyl-D-galactosamine dehydrogenase
MSTNVVHLPIGVRSLYNPTIGIVGLGYVGLPVAVAMARKFKVVGFDIDEARVQELRAGVDRTKEVSPGALSDFNGVFSSNVTDLRGLDFYIVAVPTPVDGANFPDTRALKLASQMVGKFMKRGSIVVFESTVAPGCTENDCVPILEAMSNLKEGLNFHVGYSPERINPGDKEHRLENIKKVVSARSREALEKIAFVYSAVVQPGVHMAPSIKVAEAAKILENTQRDINVALMNEMAKICARLGIDTQDVLDAAGTKWNFLRFRPGLVGGHCIGVDPYYLAHKAESLGYEPKVIKAGRAINDSMGEFVAERALDFHFAKTGRHPQMVTIFGFTFKENCPDIRNTKVIDVVRALRRRGIWVQVSDPMADKAHAVKEYGIEMLAPRKLAKSDSAIFCVAHEDYHRNAYQYLELAVSRFGTVFDVKSFLDRQACESRGFYLARL